MTLHPPALRVGDSVALVSPSGPVPPERVDAAVSVLEGWGLKPYVYPQVLAKHRYFAGTDEQRLEDTNSALADPQMRAVWCTRGGYGVQRIVDRLELETLRDDPKLIVGFSDITALHLAVWQRVRMATVHGPVAAQLDRGADSVTARGAFHALMTSEPVLVRADPDETTFPVTTAGRAEGVLLGGNLAMLASTIGTRDMPDLAGTILLLEDVNEEPYRVDRMLTHLSRAGALDRIAGIAIGQFTDCGEVVDVISERLTPLGIPLLGGLSIGHGQQHLAVPLGTRATLDADAGTLEVAPSTI